MDEMNRALLFRGLVRTKKEELAHTVMEVIAEVFEVEEYCIKMKSRERSESLYPRQAAMYFMRKIVGMTYKDIGKYFDRNHATVINACRKVDALVYHSAPDFITQFRRCEEIFITRHGIRLQKLPSRDEESNKSFEHNYAHLF